jgi:hypothetical protein
MSAFETAELPFVTIGNRQALARRALAGDPAIQAFVLRFSACFAWEDDERDCLIFYPEGDAPEELRPAAGQLLRQSL